MKVLFVIDGLGTGGAERSLAELLPGLSGAGIESTVVCLHRRPQGVHDEVVQRGDDVRVLRARHSVTRLAELRRILRSEEPDIVHTTIFSSNVIGRLASIRSGAKVLTSLVNTPYTTARLDDPDARRSVLAAVRAVDTVTARAFTHHFHAITYAVKDWAVGSLGIRPERITVVERGRDPRRLGVPDPARRRAARAKLDLDERDEIVVCVGRQEHQKGHRYLIEAVRSLIATRPGVVLLMAGRKGAMSPHLDDAARDLGGHVRFLGHQDDVPSLLAAADVFALPSLYEGLGGATIEAMALGLPIVASDIPAVREVVEVDRNAILVPPASPAQLATALGLLLTDRARAAAFGLRSTQIFRDRFTLDRSTAGMIRLYNHLAPQKVQVMGAA